jgi:hypothetical protein
MKKPTAPQAARLSFLVEDPMTANQDYHYLTFERRIYDRLITKGLVSKNQDWLEITDAGRAVLPEAVKS